MAVEPGTEPIDPTHGDNNQDEYDEDEESDDYSVEGDEEDENSYQVDEGEEEDEDEVEDEESGGGPPLPNLTAQLLPSATFDPEDDEDDYEDYQDEHDGEGTVDDPIDLASEVSSSHTGTKRGAEDLDDDDNDDDDGVSESAPKKAKV